MPSNVIDQLAETNVPRERLVVAVEDAAAKLAEKGGDYSNFNNLDKKIRQSTKIKTAEKPKDDLSFLGPSALAIKQGLVRAAQKPQNLHPNEEPQDYFSQLKKSAFNQKELDILRQLPEVQGEMIKKIKNLIPTDVKVFRDYIEDYVKNLESIGLIKQSEVGSLYDNKEIQKEVEKKLFSAISSPEAYEKCEKDLLEMGLISDEQLEKIMPEINKKISEKLNSLGTSNPGEYQKYEEGFRKIGMEIKLTENSKDLKPTIH